MLPRKPGRWLASAKLAAGDLADRSRRTGRGELEAQDFEERTHPERREEIAAELGEGTRRVYRQVRAAAPTMLRDRVLEEDIRAVRGVVEGWGAAIRLPEPAIGSRMGHDRPRTPARPH